MLRNSRLSAWYIEASAGWVFCLRKRADLGMMPMRLHVQQTVWKYKEVSKMGPLTPYKTRLRMLHEKEQCFAKQPKIKAHCPHRCCWLRLSPGVRKKHLRYSCHILHGTLFWNEAPIKTYSSRRSWNPKSWKTRIIGLGFGRLLLLTVVNCIVLLYGMYYLAYFSTS